MTSNIGCLQNSRAVLSMFKHDQSSHVPLFIILKRLKNKGNVILKRMGVFSSLVFFMTWYTFCVTINVLVI